MTGKLGKPRERFTIMSCKILLLASVLCIQPNLSEAALAQSFRVSSARGLMEVLNYADGRYTILINNQKWLQSAPTYFQVKGRRYSTADGSLVLRNTSDISGEDAVGAWRGMRYEWDAGGTPIWTTFRAYTTVSAIVFGQEYPKGAVGTSVHMRNLTQSAFPNFMTRGAEVDLGYLAYADKFVGDMKKSIERWGGSNMNIFDGVDGGPIVLFDKGQNALFMTPFNNFMVATPRYDKNSSTYGWGIMGEAQSIPTQYKLETILFYSDHGIRKAISGWGVAMRRFYNKDTSLRDADFTNTYLSYWTDNGAYYVNYYVVPSFLIQNMTYEDAILQYMEYARQLNIPFRTIQYSVWYKTDCGSGCAYGGTTAWKANPLMMPRGMAYMRDSTMLASTSHNRWWSRKTPYAKQNGGRYNFIVEKYALPQDEAFWTDMFAVSQNWGIMNYMQDWLQLPMELMNATNFDVNVAETWLNQMGSGAQKNGITIQYCMSLSRHILQSLMIPSVTQARASDDYQPSSDYSYEQWRIGQTAMFSDAVGIAPFKDTFWTTSDQPGNFYKARDPYPELQALVATLSTGPVGPGDMINGTNRTLLMKCCNEDGLILKPSRPPFPVDDQLKQTAFGGLLGPGGEVWTTYSDIHEHRFGIIFGAAMEDGSNLYAVGPSIANFGDNFPPSRVFSHRDPPSGDLAKFSDMHPVVLTSGCSRRDYCLFYTTPIFTFKGRELVLLGEREKWIPISPKRVQSIAFDQDDFRVTLTGAASEHVDFAAVYNHQYHVFRCKLSPAGLAMVKFGDMTCVGV